MDVVSVRLFGKFETQRNDCVLKGFHAARIRELFSYLLVYRNRVHSREGLAAVFWSDVPSAHSKKYLRQALWQLQGAFEFDLPGDHSPLSVDSTWVGLNAGPGLWLDVAHFEEAVGSAQGIAGNQLRPEQAARLQGAVDLYRGDLLEGCYQDWCLFERERLQNSYLATLDKLMAYCERQGLFEEGLAHGARILRYDRARERTHWQLMRLHYLAGDRTGALRQYQRCVDALRQELDVDPSAQTLALRDQIRSDHPVASVDSGKHHSGNAMSAPGALPEILTPLKRLRMVVAEAERRAQQEIASIESELSAPLSSTGPPPLKPLEC